LKNKRREVSRYFRNKNGKYLEDKIKEIATNNKNKHIIDLLRGVNKFKEGYSREVPY
jgi:hypothetical protein